MAKSASRSNKNASGKTKTAPPGQQTRPRLGLLVGGIAVLAVASFVLVRHEMPRSPATIEVATPPYEVADPPYEVLKEAMELHATSRYDECIALLESHLKLNPATRELNYKLGSLYGNKGRYARAAEHFKKELTLDPSRVEVYVQLGKAYQAMGDFEGALECYRKLAKMRPDWESSYNVGTVSAKLGKKQEAASAFEKAISFDPKQPDALVELGKIYLQKGDLTGARELFSRAVQSDSMHPAANYNLGRVLVRLGAEEEGKKLLARYRQLSKQQDKAHFYDQASRLSGSNPESNYRHGEALMGLQKYDEALQAFQTVIRKDSTFWQAYLKSGQIHLRLNRYAEGLNALKKAYGLKPNDFDVNFMLARTYALLDQRTEATTFLKQAESIDPSAVRDLRLMSDIFVQVDLDQSETLSLSEIEAALAAGTERIASQLTLLRDRFGEIDRDGDGEVTDKECYAVIEALRKRTSRKQ